MSTDAELVMAARDGDREACAAIYDRHADRLTTSVIRCCVTGRRQRTPLRRIGGAGISAVRYTYTGRCGEQAIRLRSRVAQ